MAKSPAAGFKFELVDRDTLHEQIYRELRRALMAGAVRPGQPLSYRSLAEVLGTSPMPVRDAVRRLITERALEALPNRTIIVPDLTAERIDEIYKIRLALEGLATEEAAARITPRIVRDLCAIEDQLEAALADGDVARFTDANWRFHFKIYAAAELPQLSEIIEGLWLQIGPSIWRQKPHAHVESIVRRHRSIIDALEAADGPRARAAVTEVLVNGREALKESLGQPSEATPMFPSPRRGRPHRATPIA
jgi:DNA-binding GntR family transcriptional regulator